MSDEMGWDVPVMCQHIGVTFQIVVLLKLMKLSTQKRSDIDPPCNAICKASDGQGFIFQYDIDLKHIASAVKV